MSFELEQRDHSIHTHANAYPIPFQRLRQVMALANHTQLQSGVEWDSDQDSRFFESNFVILRVSRRGKFWDRYSGRIVECLLNDSQVSTTRPFRFESPLSSSIHTHLPLWSQGKPSMFEPVIPKWCICTTNDTSVSDYPHQQSNFTLGLPDLNDLTLAFQIPWIQVGANLLDTPYVLLAWAVAVTGIDAVRIVAKLRTWILCLSFWMSWNLTRGMIDVAGMYLRSL